MSRIRDYDMFLQRCFSCYCFTSTYLWLVYNNNDTAWLKTHCASLATPEHILYPVDKAGQTLANKTWERTLGIVGGSFCHAYHTCGW